MQLERRVGKMERKKSALCCVYALAAVWRGRKGEGEHRRRMRWQRQHKCNGREKERGRDMYCDK